MRAVLIIALALFGLFATPMATAQKKLPGDSERLLPVLSAEIDTYWKDLTPRTFPAGVIDQESNWKPTATLKTSRELGCGLGQFTIAYGSDKSVRFDALSETKRLDPSLKDWDWRDCQAVKYQLRAVVLKLKSNERDCSVQMHGNDNVKACNAAKYNGGAGSIAKRIRTCRMLANCDPYIWFGHLEKQCPQANVKAVGYGESFCDINSRYPGRVFARMPKFDAILNPVKREPGPLIQIPIK